MKGLKPYSMFSDYSVIRLQIDEKDNQISSKGLKIKQCTAK